MTYAAVKIPTLCRSAHFIRLVESLKRNGWAKYTDVYVAIDFPPAEKYRKGWQEILDYVESSDFSVFASFNVIRHEKNLGGGKNIGYLSRYVFERHEKAILLEDDLEVAPNYLEYMNKCLDAFENDPDIVLVGGYSYPVKWKTDVSATCMRQNFCASTWGWGEWKKKNQEYFSYIHSGQMLKDLPKVIEEESFLSMIDVCRKEYVHTALFPYKRFMMYWCSDISLRAYLAVAGKYCISPIVSKVRNHGFDGSGVYCQEISGDGDCLDARSYNYSEQPIDEQEAFELVLNDESYLDENRERLNRFDSRTPSEMRETRFLIWLMVHVGVWAARLYVLFAIPYDVAKRGFAKIRRCYFK